MRFRSFFLLALIFLVSASTAAQQAPQRDPQAVAILQQSLVAMGGTVPSDSVATGSVALVEGSRSQTGTIRILSRGVDQSAEHIQVPSGNRAIIYSRGAANESQGGSVTALQLELVATSQSPDFPLPLLAAALNNPDVALQYVGAETLAGAAVQHIRFWNTYASAPKFQPLAEFTIKDFWIDAASGLPRKLSYTQRAGGGAEPRIPIEITFSDYRSLGGAVYPYLIKKSLNGTPWATVTIQKVAFNTGLTDADFQVQ